MATGNRSGFPARRKWAAVLAVIVLGLVAAGYGFYRVEAKHVRRDKYNELAAIGELKAGQIAQWRLERLDDALEDAESPFFVKAVETWLKDSGNAVLRDEFLQRMKLEQRTEDVANALLLDPDGRILLAAKDDPGPMDAATMKAVAQSLEGKQAALSELFRSPDGHVCIDAVAPVFDANNQPIAVVVLRSDATKFLYPLIQSWPIPSESAETLLVQKDGDNVLFLNELRHRAGAALSFRTPLNRRDLPGAQAVAGKQGMFDGRDYRGVEVLADLRPVPGSPWFMVAKVDASEITAEPHSLGEVVAVFVVLSVFLATAVVAFLYLQRQVRLYRVLHASEREKRQAQELLRENEKRLQRLFETMAEGVILINPDGRIVQANLAAERILGISRPEIESRNYTAPGWEIIRPDRTPMPPEEMAGPRAMREKQPIKDTVMGVRRPDGSVSWINVCAAPLLNSAGELEGVVGTFTDITERKRAEEALRVALIKYKTLFDCFPLGITVSDEVGNVLETNPAAEELLGMPQEEHVRRAIDSPDWRIVRPDGTPMPSDEYASVRALREKRAVENVEMGIVKPDNTIAWISVTAAPLPLEGHGVAVTYGDITERKRAEEALRESEHKISEALEFNRKILDTSSIGILTYKKSGQCVSANSAAANVVGATVAQLLAQNFHEIPSWKKSGMYQAALRALDTGIEQLLEDHLVTTFGKDAWLSFSFSSFDSAGERHLLVFASDITERKRTDEALRESEERFRTLFNRTPDGVYRSTPAGRYLDVNPAMVKMYGYDSREEMLALDIPSDVYFSSEEREARLREALEGKISVFRQRRKDGAEIWVEGYGHDLYDEQGNILFHEGILRDITDRKRAEEALRESEERFRTLFNRIPDGVYRSTHAGRFLDVNPAMVKMFGYDSREEMLALDIPKDLYFAPEDREGELLDTGRERISVIRQRRKDGSELWVEDHGHYVHDEKGNVLFHEGILRDITDRKRAEEALRESEERFRTLFDRIPDGVYRSTPAGRYLDVNPAMVKMFGYDSREEMLALDIPRDLYFSPEDHEWQFLGTGQEESDVIRQRRKDGSEIWVEVRGHYVRDEQGNILFHEGVVRDVTDRKRAEEALRESEERYRILFDRANDGIFLLSADGELISVNESLARMHGYSANEMLHMNLKDLDTPATAQLTPERMRRVLAGQALTFEVEHYHKDGHIVPLEVSASLISFGEKSFVQCFHRDITERKRAEEALRKLSSLLSRAKGEERRRIARELHDSTGQKLAALSMTVGLLHDAAGAPDAKTEKMFTDCLAMIDQCAHEIRTFSYLLHPPLLDELGLAAAISDYVEGFSKRSGVPVALDAPPDLERLPGEVEIALFHVVQESLGNIHRHAGATTVRIRLAYDAEEATLEVSDQGRGISPETMRTIEEGGGSAGVGIAGMRERLRLLGGRLEIESGGQGTTVRAIVPIAECG